MVKKRTPLYIALAIIIPLGALFLLVFSCGICGYLGDLEDSSTRREDGTVELEGSEPDTTSRYEKGVEWFNKEFYKEAKRWFVKVDSTDPNYPDAQKKIELCNGYIEKEEEEIKKRNLNEKKLLAERDNEEDRLRKKYNRLFGGRGYLHEKQSKLLRNGFKEATSGYEQAPDGSEQIAMYYQKMEGEFQITVKLQYSYSLEHHYVDIMVDYHG